jgi:formate dehydrogenase subunit delta
MMSPHQRLAYMANQIARNLAAQGDEAAAMAVADHILAFWDPRMKARLTAMDRALLEPIAARAVELLSAHAVGGPQSPATSFRGGSDAG